MQIMVHHGGRQLGPFAPAELQGLVDAGTVALTDLAWVEGTPSWVPLGSLLTGVPPLLSPAVLPYSMPPDMRPTSSLAIASLVLGGLSYIACTGPLTGIPAIICGHMARGEIRRSRGLYKGDGLALTGLIMGYIGCSVLLLFLIPFFMAGAIMPFALLSGSESETKKIETAQAHAATIVSACRSYARAHDGVYPASLEELAPAYLIDRRQLACPLSDATEEVGFEYYGASQKDPPRGMVLIASKGRTKDGKRVIGLVNGKTSVDTFDPP
jgi:hypothetical protein